MTLHYRHSRDVQVGDVIVTLAGVGTPIEEFEVQAIDQVGPVVLRFEGVQRLLDANSGDVVTEIDTHRAAGVDSVQLLRR